MEQHPISNRTFWLTKEQRQHFLSLYNESNTDLMSKALHFFSVAIAPIIYLTICFSHLFSDFFISVVSFFFCFHARILSTISRRILRNYTLATSAPSIPAIATKIRYLEQQGATKFCITNEAIVNGYLVEKKPLQPLNKPKACVFTIGNKQQTDEANKALVAFAQEEQADIFVSYCAPIESDRILSCQDSQRLVRATILFLLEQNYKDITFYDQGQEFPVIIPEQVKQTKSPHFLSETALVLNRLFFVQFLRYWLPYKSLLQMLSACFLPYAYFIVCVQRLYGWKYLTQQTANTPDYIQNLFKQEFTLIKEENKHHEEKKGREPFEQKIYK